MCILYRVSHKKTGPSSSYKLVYVMTQKGDLFILFFTIRNKTIIKTSRNTVEGYQKEQLHQSWSPDYIHIIYISRRQTDK